MIALRTAELEALTAALSARPSALDAEAWQGMNTAPRDGTSILIMSHGGGMEALSWRPTFKGDPYPWTNEWGGTEWAEHSCVRWRPLPAPPAIRPTTQTETEADDGR